MSLTPYEFPDLFSSIILDGKRSPGKVTFTGHDRDQDWDVAQPTGKSGASSKLNGAPVGQFQATFQLTDNADFDAWPEFQQVIESSTNGAAPKALSIFHPDLALNRFTDVVSGGVGGIVRDSRGGAIVQVKFLEYRPPKAAPSKAATGKPGSSSGTGTGAESSYDPNAAARDELNSLLEEAGKP